MIGRSLGHYRITAAIGAGGMGEVYRATDSKLGRDVAIKMLPAAVAQDPERLARFEREARSLIIEGMAQTAGIMVGHAGDFKEKVILAKITRAEFTDAARPGYAIRFTAEMDNFSRSGASTHGRCELIDPHTGGVRPLADAAGNTTTISGSF